MNPRQLETRLSNLEKMVCGLGEYLHHVGLDVMHFTNQTPDEGELVYVLF